MKKLYLVDVSSLFFRAFYAIPPLNTKEGLPTNALYGFLNMTVKLLRDIKPDYMAYCFDRKEKSFRSEMYPEYKANRSEMPEDLIPQVPYVRKLTDLLGIPHFDKEGYEADDVIGSLTSFGRANDLEVVIVSGDKDFAQLISPFVSMYDTMKDKRYDEQGVVDKWGVSADQMIDYLALVGDSSDNIPGVRGVGPKGAQKLLAEFKDLVGIYENVEKIPGKSTKQKIIDNEDMAFLSKELVTICSDIDFGISKDDLKLKIIDKPKLAETLNNLEFKGFAKKLAGDGSVNLEPNNASPRTNANVPRTNSRIKIGKEKKIKISSLQHEVISSRQLDEMIPAYSEVFGMQTDRGFLLGFGEKVFQVESVNGELGEILSKKMLAWKGFNLKRLWRDTQFSQVIKPKCDLLLSAYVLRPGNILSFEDVYESYTGKKVPDLASPVQVYSCYLELESILTAKVTSDNATSVLEEIELPLVPVLFEMEKAGIIVDSKELAEQSLEVTAEIDVVSAKIFAAAGESFNIASPKQLAQILFEKLNLPALKKTKTGFSTGSDVLLKLAKEHPICNQVIEYRELAKLKSTYLDALPQLVDKNTGRIHTHFRQAATATGRLSSVNPNLQNIPIRTEKGRRIRRAFQADKGSMLLSVDYSQIELRVLAHITSDPALCRAFEQDLDIHAATASEVFGVELNEVTPDLRRKAKAVNFGIAYGQGAFGLSESLGISRKEASDIIGNYFGRFKKVKEYMENTIEEAKAKGYVESVFGRRRYIDEIKSKNSNLQKFGERAAINAPIQGTSSDLVKKAMISVFDEIESKMLLQVHDELLLECESDQVESEAQQVKEIMENVATLNVPFKANVAWGNNWEDAHA